MSINNSHEKLKIYSTVYEDLDLHGINVEDFVNTCQKLIYQNPDVKLVFSEEYTYSDTNLVIVSVRDETDEEFEARHEAIRVQAELKEQKKIMNALMKKDKLTDKEKAELIKFIEGK